MSPAIGSMDLSRVYRHRVFQSHSIRQSQDYLRHALSDHKLRCGAGAVDVALHSAGSRRLKMFILRYGPEVEVQPKPFDGFALVQMPLRGSAEIESDGHRITVSPGQVAVIAPRRDLRLRWSRDCEQLILRLPHGLLREAAARGASTPPLPPCAQPDGSLLAPATLLQEGAAGQWSGLVQSLLELAHPADNAAGCHPAWLDFVELGLAYFMLTQQRDMPAAGGAPLRDDDKLLDDANLVVAQPALEPPLAAAERYMRSRLCAPLALEDLAQAAGVSSRTLHMYCKRRFGVGPMVWLRNLRLEAARQKLAQGGSGTVTDAAMEFGFGHLGRFSAYYRERFGELPRQTAAATR